MTDKKKMLLEDKQIENFQRLMGLQPKKTKEFLASRKALNESLDAGGVPGEEEDQVQEAGLPGEEGEEMSMGMAPAEPEMGGDTAPKMPGEDAMGGMGDEGAPQMNLSPEDAQTLISRITDAISGLTGLDIDVDTEGEPDGDGDADDMGMAPVDDEEEEAPMPPMAEGKGDGLKPVKVSKKNTVSEDEVQEEGEPMEEGKGDGLKPVKVSKKNTVSEDEVQEEGEQMEEGKGDGLKPVKVSKKNTVNEQVALLAKQVAKEAVKEILSSLKKK